MPDSRKTIRQTARVSATLLVVVIAALLAWQAWKAYVYSPWTRDARVQANVANIAPEVSGTVERVAVRNDEYVHKGDLLFQIDPVRFKNAVLAAKAALAKARAESTFARQNAERLEQLPRAGVSSHDLQQAQSQARSTAASVAQAKANLDQAQQNLKWTTVKSPVTGYVTHLTLDKGSYARQGESAITIVDADTFRIVAYFEETKLANLQVGDPADIELMAGGLHLKGHVASIGRGIALANNTSGERNLPSVSPTFQWVRLAQRIPVTIDFDKPVEKLPLSVGLTATVHIRPEDRKNPDQPPQRQTSSP